MSLQVSISCGASEGWGMISYDVWGLETGGKIGSSKESGVCSAGFLLVLFPMTPSHRGFEAQSRC